MSGCLTPTQGSGFIATLTGYLDCQAETFGAGAYQALAAPGSALAVMLTGFLTIFIALIGYNLLLGRSMTVREGTLAFVKIGAVLALTTSWPAYRAVVYDLAVDGPAQLASEIGGPAGVIGADGTLLARLDGLDQGLAQLSLLGAGNPGVDDAQVPPPPFVGFNAFALGGSRILFLIASAGSLAAIRIIIGLMLALGPFFIAFFLFDATRGLFEGWVRVLAGAAVAAVAVPLALGLQLALLEPWLASTLAQRAADEALPGAPAELFVIVTLFAIVVVAALAGSARVARGFRMPTHHRHDFASDSARAAQSAATVQPLVVSRASEGERTRAAAVASTLVSMSRRELGVLLTSGDGASAAVRATGSPQVEHTSIGQSISIGRSFQRRARIRGSASANRRDANG